HRAVMPRADGNAASIEQLGHIVSMYAIEGKTDDACLAAGGWPEKANACDVFQDLVSQRRELALVCVDGRQANLVQVIDRHSKADGRHNRRRACFQLSRQLGRLEATQLDPANHSTAA